MKIQTQGETTQKIQPLDGQTVMVEIPKLAWLAAKMIKQEWGDEAKCNTDQEFNNPWCNPKESPMEIEEEDRLNASRKESKPLLNIVPPLEDASRKVGATKSSDIETKSKPCLKRSLKQTKQVRNKMKAERNLHSRVKNTVQEPEIEIIEIEEEAWLPLPAQIFLSKIEMTKVNNKNLESLVKKAKKDHRSVIYYHVSTHRLNMNLFSTQSCGRTQRNSIPSTLASLIKIFISGLYATMKTYSLTRRAQ